MVIVVHGIFILCMMLSAGVISNLWMAITIQVPCRSSAMLVWKYC